MASAQRQRKWPGERDGAASFFRLLRQAQAALAHTRGVDFFCRQDDALRKVWHIIPLVVLCGKERLGQQRLGQRFLPARDPPA